MKILFDHPSPFLLAHGGFQIQIEQTKKALEDIGVEVEWLRWWDANQSGDIIHYFGVAPLHLIEQAHRKAIKIIQTNLFTETCNRSDFHLVLQGLLTRAVLAFPAGNGIKRQLAWKSFGTCDANIVGLRAEEHVLKKVYGVSPARIFVIPLGLPEVFLKVSYPAARGDFLISVGTITERKNTVPLARRAREARVPILFIGKPYDESDPYWHEFTALIDHRWVRHQPHVESFDELIRLYQSARGCVVMSRYENWCLVAHEAAACGLPLLLPSAKWSHERFGHEAQYFPGTPEKDASALRAFYEQCPSLPSPKVRLDGWDKVGTQLKEIYERVLSTSQ